MSALMLCQASSDTCCSSVKNNKKIRKDSSLLYIETEKRFVQELISDHFLFLCFIHIVCGSSHSVKFSFVFLWESGEFILFHLLILSAGVVVPLDHIRYGYSINGADVSQSVMLIAN